ncbi:MAG: DUF1549 and DUF1553 domain-containing protein [Gemmataceae bacterium]|nr:DUF1549 and DUF1553 domain-containing protein [Gemmataceae bacterium]
MSWLHPTCISVSVFVLIAGDALAQAPLSSRIDQEIHQGLQGTPAAAIASDGEFLRRVTLDLTGIIPSAAEARAFFKDPAKDKRAKLIDRLLASDGFARHMQNQFDVLWLDRRPDKYVKRPEWLKFLRDSFAANKPYDQLVREILSADGVDPKTRAAAAFYLNREGEPNLLTKDISRLFLGMNLQCAQCHDHPLVDAYKQDFYYGVYAFLNRSYVINDKKLKMSVFAEKGEGEVSYQSVFVPKVTKSSGMAIPYGKAIAEPKIEKGKEYVTAPAKGERGVPKFSRRAQLAGALTSPDNPRFARAAANRLWSFVFGRGIVHPVEFDHPDNPPSHPELLDHLAKDFAARKYDVKALLRDLVSSQAYQRASEPPKGVKDVDPAKFAVAPLRPLTPEQFAWSVLQALGELDAERQALGAKATEAALYAKYAGQAAPIVRLFANQPGEPATGDFEATLDQTLFLRNSEQMRSLLAPRRGDLADRLNNLKDAAPFAEELYLSVLTRLPAPDEAKDVADYLARRGADRQVAVQELIWALVTSAEFRFNH